MFKSVTKCAGDCECEVLSRSFKVEGKRGWKCLEEAEELLMQGNRITIFLGLT